MLLLTPHMRILLAVDAIDFRKGIPGLMGVCKKCLQEDPFAGILFVFRNNKATAIKILIYDGQGFWLIMKKFSKGRLKWWPQDSKLAYQVTANELHIILAKGVPYQAKLGQDWLPITPGK